MLINISNILERSEIELELDFKVIHEFYISGRKTSGSGVIRKLERSEDDFLLNEFIWHPLSSANEIRMKAILENKVVLRNIFIHDFSNGKVIYYARMKTDMEKFSDVAGDLF
jgi:hypothetical protein